MRLSLFLLALSVSSCAKALPPLTGDKTCELKADSFSLNLGQTKAPTYAGVILPDGRLLRLRYAPESIDTLGPNYEKGALKIVIRPEFHRHSVAALRIAPFELYR